MFCLIRHAGYHPLTGFLTPDGIVTTKDLARRIKNLSVSWRIIFTSPSKRTMETARVLERILLIQISIDKSLSMNHEHVHLLPPYETRDTIYVSHLPVITHVLRAWSRAFHIKEPSLVDVAQGAIVDPEKQTIERI